MSSLPKLTNLQWLERTGIFLAAAVIGVSGLNLAGRILRLQDLLPPFAGLPALEFNAALGFLLIGMTALALELNRPRFAPLGLLPAAIGGLSLIQDILQRDFLIDELLVRDRLQAHAEHPGRMAAIVAVWLLVGGTTLVLWSPRADFPARLFIKSIIGTLLASAGFATLLGYAAELPFVYAWGSVPASSPVAAILIILSGALILLRAWRTAILTTGSSPDWSPVPAIVGGIACTLLTWHGITERENNSVAQTTLAQVENVAVEIKATLDQQMSEIERLFARPWGDQAENNFTAWAADVAAHNHGTTTGYASATTLGCLGYYFVDISRRTVWVQPDKPDANPLYFDHAAVTERNTALNQARLARGPVISQTISVDGNFSNQPPRLGFAIYVPVIRSGRLAGFVAAEYAYRTFFQALLRQLKIEPDYHVAISIGGLPVLGPSPQAKSAAPAYLSEKSLTIADRRVRLSLAPSTASLRKNQTRLPEFTLAAGLSLTLLVSLTLHLARRARSGQRAAELSHKKLSVENEERRRIEARLKISDERLRLALDSTQIGIFEWNVPSGHIYYSPGLWAMLGYDSTRMPTTVEAWQILIYPEDLPLYRRRTETQLHGTASFIEPEYRVRASNGDWRWVYTRSKTVATTPDGRPARIIGTVQDITARREAEFALRESQTEARKLSLVAAKTDNPVFIGAPDGKIEWANEAFCRVMKYRLDEVIGRNPAQFVIGPATNLRTLVRVRAAMRNGQGISTDILSYSKSGRKYHLQVEAQPIRNTNAEVEYYIAVATDITARVETELQLRRAKTEADEASRAKSEFLASMSHEIRTPMNGVIGMTSLLMETPLNIEQRDLVSTIRNSGDALLTVINDILDFSKIESGKMELEKVSFELSLCIEEALDIFAVQAATKKLEVGYQIASDVPAWIVSDITRLRQIIVNLVNNGIKFTPTGGVSVEVRRIVRPPQLLRGLTTRLGPTDPVILEFTVRDTGIGIPASRIDRLFKAFSQVDSSITRKYGGTGLGLAICQRFCVLLGGAIRVESAVGQGSAFIFTIQTEKAADGTASRLPSIPRKLAGGLVLCIEKNLVTQIRLSTIFDRWKLECAVVPDVPAALALLPKLTRSPALLIMDSGQSDDSSALDALTVLTCPRMLLCPLGHTPAFRAGAPLTASTSKPIRTSSLIHGIISLFHTTVRSDIDPIFTKEPLLGEEIPLEVLLAEDNPVNQKVALRFLQRLGYRADAVTNGLAVVSALQSRHYDLVLMDVQMPEIDGYEATRQIRARLPAKRQPIIIALTANAMQGDRQLAVNAGMNDYISKPVKIPEIEAAIRRHFSKTSTSAPPQVLKT